MSELIANGQPCMWLSATIAPECFVTSVKVVVPVCPVSQPNFEDTYDGGVRPILRMR